jgi:D-tyrosyl-tRNA(Tyr) deacylase
MDFLLKRGVLKYLMRLVIQRVQKASVEVKNKKIGSIKLGLFVLLGIEENDTEKNLSILAEKLLKLRIMSDEKDKMNLSIMDTTKEILVVSQFTLMANTQKGNRPSFVKAANPDKARDLYRYFCSYLVEKGALLSTGKFGTYMNIKCELDGPVTITLES